MSFKIDNPDANHLETKVFLRVCDINGNNFGFGNTLSKLPQFLSFFSNLIN